MDPRDAVPADFEPLAKLWYDGWRDAHLEIAPPGLKRVRQPENFRERMEKMLPEVRVVGPPGEPIGFHYVVHDELDQLYVAAGARGTGTAVTLIRDAEAKLAARGVTLAWLACAIGNQRAARFYEKRGWRLAGPATIELPTPDGPFALEVWRYEKELG
jgi:GNAT superfamily N-acetyltransferase